MKNNSMKNLKKLIAICLMIFSISLCSCGGQAPVQTANTMEYRVSSEMSNLENAENLSDETIKALSIVIRTKLYNGESISILKNDGSADSSENFADILDNTNNTSENSTNTSENSAGNVSSNTTKSFAEKTNNSTLNKTNIKNTNNSPLNDSGNSEILNGASENSNNSVSSSASQRIAKNFDFAVNKTSNQVLSGFDSTKNNKNSSLAELPKNIIIATDSKLYTWQKVIKKSELLRFLAKKNISLANISEFKTNTDENSNIISIVIAGKDIDFSEIKSEFDLPSSKISSIKNNISEIFITGSGIDCPNVFDIKVSESLASSGLSYEQILSYFFDSYNIINLAKN